MAETETGLKNFLRYQVLMRQVTVGLRRIFSACFQDSTGEEWVSSPTYGHQFITTIGSEVYKMLSEADRKPLENGDIRNWDFMLLSRILLKVEFKQEGTAERNYFSAKAKAFVRELIQIRNKHEQSKTVTSEEIDFLWKKVVPVAVDFGYCEKTLEELRVAENIGEIDFGAAHFLDALNVKRANRLKEEGNKEVKSGNFEKALQHYRTATSLPDISDHTLAMLYSNIAAVYVIKVQTEKDQSNYLEIALENAKNAVTLHPNWWKAHFRLGKVFEAMGELKNAVFAFDCAVLLKPADKSVRTTRDDCRRNLAESETREQFCNTRVFHNLRKPFLNLMSESSLESVVTQEIKKETQKLLAEKGDANPHVLEANKLLDEAESYDERNYEIAAALYEKAANEGSAEGMYHLAMFTKDGVGVKKDMKKAVEWLKKAAEQPSIINGFPNYGVAQAEFKLGMFSMEGTGLPLNVEVGISWFQRSSDHGEAHAACILGKVYLDGYGVKSDTKRGIQYWKLAASRKLIPAMDALYEYFLQQENVEQANKWFKEALKNGSAAARQNRRSFKEKLKKIPTKPEIAEVFEWEKENGLDAGELPIYDRFLRKVSATEGHLGKYFCDEILSSQARVNNNQLPCGEEAFAFDVPDLLARAANGSKTAEGFLTAIHHFWEGITLFEAGNNESEAVHQIAECYRIQYKVAEAQWPFSRVRESFLEMVEKKLKKTNKNKASPLDCDLRVCYAFLRMNYLRETTAFLHAAIAKYPDERRLHYLHAYLHEFLKEFIDGLRYTKEALRLFPNDAKLLDLKAQFLMHQENPDPQEIISAFEDFLRVAEIDEQRYPDAHYHISSAYQTLLYESMLKASDSAENRKKDSEMFKLMMKHYELGLEAEKSLLPCFLPYDSGTKKLLESLNELHGSLQCRKKVASTDSKVPTKVTTEHVSQENAAFFVSPVRSQVIKDHRKVICDMAEKSNTQIKPKKKHTLKRKPVTASQITGMKAITLRDMDHKKNRAFKGSVLKLTSIEDAIVGLTFVRLVVEDENNDVQRCHVYNFSHEHDVQNQLGFGCKFSLVNPDLIVMKDGKPTIRVDDPISQLLYSDRDSKRCRFCGKGDSTLKCSMCRKTFYCSKECQVQDWKLLEHKLICRRAKAQ